MAYSTIASQTTLSIQLLPRISSHRTIAFLKIRMTYVNAIAAYFLYGGTARCDSNFIKIPCIFFLKTFSREKQRHFTQLNASTQICKWSLRNLQLLTAFTCPSSCGWSSPTRHGTRRVCAPFTPRPTWFCESATSRFRCAATAVLLTITDLAKVCCDNIKHPTTNFVNFDQH